MQAAYFDLGGEGVAYHDTDKTNHGSGELNYKYPQSAEPYTRSFHVWNLAEAAGRITFKRPGIQLLTLHYNQGNNLARFDFIQEDVVKSTTPN